MNQQAEIQSSVYLCTFECIIRQANIAMKFPCSYFTTWSTPNGKVIVKTEKHNPKQYLVTFQEKIILTTQLIYNHSKVQFLKRQTLIQLFLVSKSRPDQNKLVGRVTIDLAKVINVGMYAQPTQFQLNFCSVQGSIIMQFRANDRKLTSLSVQSLDRSSFMDYVSRSALKGESKQHGARAKGHSLQKQNQDKPLKTDYQVKTPRQNPKLSYLNDNQRQRPKLNKSYQDNDAAQQYTKNPDFLKNQTNIRQSQRLKNARQNKVILQKPSFQKNQLNNKHQTNGFLVNSKQSFALKKQQSLQPSKRQNRFFKNDKSKQKILVFAVPQITKQIKEAQIQDNQFLNKKTNNKDHSFLDGKVKILEQQINLSQIKNEQLEEKFRLMEKDKRKLVEANASLSQRINGLTEQSKRMADQKKNIYQTLSNKDKILDELNEQISQKEQTISKLQIQRGSLKIKIQNYVHEVQYLRKANQRIQSLLFKNVQLQNRLLQDKNKIQAYEQKITKLQNTIKDLTEANAKFTEETIKELQKKNTILTKLAQLQNQNISLKTNIQSAKYNQDLGLKTQDKQTQNQILTLQQDINKKNEEIYSLKLIESYLKTQNDTIIKEFRQQQSKCGELQFIVLQQKQKNLQLALKLEVFDQKRIVQDQLSNNVDVEISKLNQQILSLKTIIADMESNLSAQRAAHNEQISSLKGTLQNLQNRLNTQTAKQNDQTVSLKVTISNLQIQRTQIVNSHINKLKHLQQSIQYYNKQYAQSQSKNNSLKETNNQLNLKIESLQQQIIQLSNNQQVFQLNQQISTLKNKISILHDNIQILENQKINQLVTQPRKDYRGEVINEGQDNWQNRCIQQQLMINKLNSNLQEQINQNNALEQTVIRYMDKQVKMKQTLTVLQRQSKQIYGLVQQKQQNQITYQKMIKQLQRQVDQLKNMINGPNISPLKHVYQYEQLQTSFPSSDIRDIQNHQPNKIREHLIIANEQLSQQNKRLQQINYQLNQQIITINIFHNQSISKFQTEISRLSTELEQQYKHKNVEIDIWKSKAKNKQNQALAFQQEVKQLKNILDQIQQEKFGLGSLNNQKDIRIMELVQYNQNLIAQIQASKLTPKKQLLIDVLSELKQNLVQKSTSIQSQWQSLIQNCLDKSMVVDDGGKVFNLQQKSRLLSKQLHKLKSQMLKTDWRNQHEKITFMGLFKKCETIVSELIAVVESMNTNQSSFL